MAAVTKDALIALLAHEHTRQALGRLAHGEDVRRVAADVAGQALASKLGQLFGAPKDVTPQQQEARRPHQEPIDAEFVTVNVTDEARKRK